MNATVVSTQELRAMPLYRQFIVLMMLSYAALMAGVTVLFAANGEIAAVGTALVGVAVGVAAVTIVPAKLGATE